MTPVLAITEAFHFATEKHSDQRRKGENEEPYVNHLAEVASLLSTHTNGEDHTLILGGLLHDTVEDTDTTYQELCDKFGAEVADLVMEVTDDKSLEKQERKRLQVEKTPYKSDRAKMIKMADKISNLNSILKSPPADWTTERKAEYFEWAKKVVDGCRGVNDGLEKQFDAVYTKGIKKFTPGNDDTHDHGMARRPAPRL